MLIDHLYAVVIGNTHLIAYFLSIRQYGNQRQGIEGTGQFLIQLSYHHCTLNAHWLQIGSLMACLIDMQDLTTLDVTKLTPLSPEVISRQATINIGEKRMWQLV